LLRRERNVKPPERNIASHFKGPVAMLWIELTSKVEFLSKGGDLYTLDDSRSGSAAIT
jgi:hypothetical protein